MALTAILTIGVALLAGLMALAGCAAERECKFAIVVAPDLTRVVELAVFVMSGAVYEEILFRGFLLNALSEKLGALRANVTQAAGFGLLHLLVYRDLAVLFPIAVLGFCLGALALRFRSIWIPISFHCAWNLGVVLLARPFVESPFSRRDEISSFDPLFAVKLNSVSSNVESMSLSLLNSPIFVVLITVALSSITYAIVAFAVQRAGRATTVLSPPSRRNL